MKNIINKIILFAAVLFSAGFTTSANAQTAEMSVFVRASGNYGFQFNEGIVRADLSLNMREYIAALSAGAANSHLVFRRINNNGSRYQGGGIVTANNRYNGLVYFVDSTGFERGGMEEGDFIILNSAISETFNLRDIRVRLYDIGGDSLAMATVVGKASSASGDQFFLNTLTWEPTQIPSVNNLGYDDGSSNTETPLSSSGSSGGSSGAGAIIGGVAVVGGLIWLLSSGGEEGEFNYSPDFGYSLTESGYSANVGGRADFRKDNWHLYYSAKQTNANGDFGDFRYTSGGEYKTDLFAAAFSESVAGETANYNFSLSADVDGRLVDFSPVYRLHSEYDKGEFSTRNELNLQGNFRYDGWTINSSAGFRWENPNDFSENARFQINAVHLF